MVGIQGQEEFPFVAGRSGEDGDVVEAAGPQRLEPILFRQQRSVPNRLRHVESQPALLVAVGEHYLPRVARAQEREQVPGREAVGVVAGRGRIGHGAGVDEELRDHVGAAVGMSGFRVVARVLGFGDRIAPGAAALRKGSVEESLRCFGEQERVDVRSAGALTEDRHVAGVATELLDVRLNPAKGRDLIEGAKVAARLEGVVGFCAKRRVGEPAEGAEAIGDRYHHDVLGARQPRAVVHRGARPTPRVAPAMDPDHDRQSRVPGRDVVGLEARGPDVEGEAIFVAGESVLSLGGDASHRRARLHAGSAELERVAGRRPGGRRTRCAPTKRAGRGQRIRQPDPGMRLEAARESDHGAEREQPFGGDVGDRSRSFRRPGEPQQHAAAEQDEQGPEQDKGDPTPTPGAGRCCLTCGGHDCPPAHLGASESRAAYHAGPAARNGSEIAQSARAGGAICTSGAKRTNLTPRS